MTPLVSTAESDALVALPRLPRDEGGPVFAEPWQAQAFALAVKLSEQGHFTWKEWAAALAHELQVAADRGEPDDGSRYYEHWLAALERLVTAKGLADPAALVTRKAAWAEAYRSTPHGKPVELRHASATLDARWVLGGLASVFATYWLLRYAQVALVGANGPWALGLGAGWRLMIPQVGFVASAGLGSLLGIRHALEPDHLAAVVTLMTGERSSGKAAWLGAWWGVGHTLTLFAAGAVLVVLRADMPVFASQFFDLCVVLLLMGFGLRAIYQGARRELAGPTHVHRGAGPPASRDGSRWALARRPLVVGAVHGLAGSGALTAFVVAELPSTGMRLGYLALFGVGSTMGMALLSGLFGWSIARVGVHEAIARGLSLAVGSVSIVLGLFWGRPLVEGLL